MSALSQSDIDPVIRTLRCVIPSHFPPSASGCNCSYFRARLSMSFVSIFMDTKDMEIIVLFACLTVCVRICRQSLGLFRSVFFSSFCLPSSFASVSIQQPLYDPILSELQPYNTLTIPSASSFWPRSPDSDLAQERPKQPVYCGLGIAPVLSWSLYIAASVWRREIPKLRIQ